MSEKTKIDEPELVARTVSLSSIPSPRESTSCSEHITELGPNDVLCGRGGLAAAHEGNVRFRNAIENRKNEYNEASKKKKREIAQQALCEVHKRGGRFLQISTRIAGTYEIASESKALDKCLHALREKKRGRPDNEGAIPDDLEKLHSTCTGAEEYQVETESDEVNDIVNSFIRSNSNRPTMPQEEADRERSLMTADEKLEAINDIFGKYCTVEAQNSKQRRISMEDSYIKSALVMMRREIDWIPNESKQALLDAQPKCCSEEFSDNRLKAFLRCVDWHPKGAAERFAKYWEKRLEHFGPDKYYLPMTLSGACRDDMTALKAGLCCPLPYPDASGRQIIWYSVVRNTFEGYTVESMLRAIWYVMEVVSQRGTDVVRLVSLKDATMLNIDGELFCEHTVLTRDCWPVKVLADHDIAVSPALARNVAPLVIAVRGKELRVRRIVHEVAPDSEIREQLAEYGILADMLPTEIGGRVQLSIDEWITNRQKVESEGSNVCSNEVVHTVGDGQILDMTFDELIDEAGLLNGLFDDGNDILDGSSLEKGEKGTEE